MNEQTDICIMMKNNVVGENISILQGIAEIFGGELIK